MLTVVLPITGTGVLLLPTLGTVPVEDLLVIRSKILCWLKGSMLAEVGLLGSDPKMNDRMDIGSAGKEEVQGDIPGPRSKSLL